MTKSRESHIRANSKYNKTHTKSVAFRLNLVTDADIIEKLESVPNKQGYFKELIRADIEQEKKST